MWGYLKKKKIRGRLPSQRLPLAEGKRLNSMAVSRRRLKSLTEKGFLYERKGAGRCKSLPDPLSEGENMII